MNQLLLTLALLILTGYQGTNTPTLMLPELDGALIHLWKSAHDVNAKQLTQGFERVEKTWLSYRQEFVDKAIPHFDMDITAQDIDRSIKLMKDAVAKDDHASIRYISYKILKDFREIRRCVQAETYALDELLITYDLYIEFHRAADDPMMGLYEWNEFVHIYDEMRCQFDRYQIAASMAFRDDRLSIEKRDHDSLVLDALACLTRFEVELGEAYSPDFQEPCDEIGEALFNLIGLYESELPPLN